MAQEALSIGLDIGGTKTLIGFVTESGEIVAKKQFPTESDHDKHLSKCRLEIEKLLQAEHLEIKQVDGLGVNVPGLANPEQGKLILAPFLRWENLDIRRYFREEWPDLRVEVSNDVNACALGELIHGKGKSFNDFLWVTISTGIGSGLIINRQVVNGKSMIAGEIGHVTVDWEKGRLCPCGNLGCLEAHASGTALSKLAEAFISNNKNSPLVSYFSQNDLDLTAENLAKAAYSGIQSAIEMFEEAGIYIGRALSYVINLLNPDAIIVGGGVSRSFDLLEPSIRKVVQKAVIHETNKKIPILTTDLGYEAGLIGAASLVHYAKRGREKRV